MFLPYRLPIYYFVYFDYMPALFFPQCKIHVIHRKDGRLLPIRYECLTMFCFHHINAYEEDDHIVVDMCCYDNTQIIDSFFFKNIFDKDYKMTALAEARRLVLPLNVKACIETKTNFVIGLLFFVLYV